MGALILVHILEQHGPRLTVAQAAKVLGLSEGTLRNRLSSKQIKQTVSRASARSRVRM